MTTKEKELENFLDLVIRKGELQYHSKFGCYNIHEQFYDIVTKANELKEKFKGENP